jgi:hypothetical protein
MSHESSMDQLTGELLRDFKSSKPLRPTRLFFAFVFAAYLSVAIQILLSGDLRPGWAMEVSAQLRIQLELFLMVLTSLSAAFLAMQLGIPEERQLRFRNLKVIGLPILTLGLFFLMIIWGVISPALSPTDDGYRPTCTLQTIGFSIGPLVLVFFLLRQLRPVALVWTSLLASLSATMPVVAYMHIACKYEPLHIAFWHCGPLLFVVCLGTLIGMRILRWWDWGSRPKGL